MNSQISCTMSAQENVLNLMESLIKTVPEKSSGFEASGPEPSSRNGPSSSQPQGKTDNRRILKMRQQVAKQSNFINDLKKKIRLLEAMSPKTISDHEELSFLRSRLAKENDLLKSLLNSLIEEQRKDTNQAWEPIQLSSDPVDDVCRNPWMLGNAVAPDQRFSFDSTLSSLSSKALVDGGDVNERLNNELMNRDRVIEILQGRVEALTADVMNVKRHYDAVSDKTPKQTKFCEADMFNRLRFYQENTDALERNLQQMGAALNVIRSELGANLTGALQEPVGCSTFITTTYEDGKPNEETRRSSVASKRGDDQYNLLLKEFNKKSGECKKLTDRLAKACLCQNESPEKLELDVLKNRCSELLNEQEDFKILIKEQSDQLDEYRNKYLAAQQKVEEQKLQMEKMDVTNNRIEEQINLEVQRIKTKFQDKLRQLTPFPRLLEAEEEKVKKLKDSNEKLLEELKSAAKVVKSLESRLHNVHSSQNAELEKAYSLLKVEIRQLEDTLQSEKDKIENLQGQLTAAQKETDELRTETANIIARTNDRAQEDRKAAQARIHDLEVELAQSRAAAAVTIGNREEALREMQRQIGVLSGSLEDARFQIQSLRNQLTFMQNERYGSRA